MNFKITILTLFLFVSALCTAQETITHEQAKAILGAQKTPRMLTVPDYSPKYRLFAGKKSGDIVVNGREVYKVSEFRQVTAYNAAYIFLDTKKLTAEQFEALKKTILDQYREGTPFEDLADDYNMDGNPNSLELKYIDGQMVETFEAAVREHKKGEVFTVDTPGNGWYHIVRKNEDNRVVMAVVVEYVYVTG